MPLPVCVTLPPLLGQQLNVTRKDPGLVSPYHSLPKLSRVAHPGSWEGEAGGWMRVQGYPWLQKQVEADLGYLKQSKVR